MFFWLFTSGSLTKLSRRWLSQSLEFSARQLLTVSNARTISLRRKYKPISRRKTRKMFTVNQLICHAIGDYILQSEWMANQKTKSHIPALCHALFYSIPFLLLRPSWLALFVIISTHFVIDRFRLARFVCWLKNWLCPYWITNRKVVIGRRVSKEVQVANNIAMIDAKLPADINHGEIVNADFERKYVWTWEQCHDTGYPPNTPKFLSVWLMIITDNLLHIIINALALKYL